MTPSELQRKINSDKVPLGPEQLQVKINAERQKPAMQKAPFIARHPTLYGLYGVTKGVVEAMGKIGHVKYADPYELRKLLSLSPQEQRRQLLMDTLEDVVAIAFGVIKPAKVPKQTQQIAKKIISEGKSFIKPGKIVYRIEEPGVRRATVDKPQGIYTTPIDLKSPHKELGGKQYFWEVNSKAKILELNASGLIETNRGMVGKSGGIATLEKFLPEAELQRLLSLSKNQLQTKLSAKYPNIQWNKYFDQQEMLEGYAGLLARRKGYDAIHALDKINPEFTEFIGLTEKALKPIKTPKIAPRIEEKVSVAGRLPVIERIQTALKKAKPIRKEQERLYTVERGKRAGKAIEASEKLTGEARFRAKTAALKGKMPQAEFEPLNIAQEDVDILFNMVDEKLPHFWEQITAGRGLAKLFGEFGGTVPQQSELKLLRKVFPGDFIKTLTSKRPLIKRLKELGYEVINVPRAIMASFDLSAPFRQGIFVGPKHPLRFFQSFFKMFKQFGSEKAYQAVQEGLTQKKWYNLLREEGLQITEIGASLEAREEAFMGANLAEKIPIAGRGIRASNRAYTGFLNKLRVDVANDLVENAYKVGLDPENNLALVQAITKYVNAATGRGNLPNSLKNSAILLNSLFFSPRLMSSRITLLNPVYYVKQPAFVRKEALKSLLAFSSSVAATLGLAKMNPNVDVGTDIRSANFGKIRIGDTRIDIMGGFQQYLRAAGQLISGKYISSTTGKEYTLGEGYKPLTRADILQRQIESKLSPPASFAWDLLKQQTPTGKPVSVPKEIGRRFVPMVVQDLYDIAQDDPNLLPLTVLGVFGVGLQTYAPRTSKSTVFSPLKGINKIK